MYNQIEILKIEFNVLSRDYIDAKRFYETFISVSTNINNDAYEKMWVKNNQLYGAINDYIYKIEGGKIASKAAQIGVSGSINEKILPILVPKSSFNNISFGDWGIVKEKFKNRRQKYSIQDDFEVDMLFTSLEKLYYELYKGYFKVCDDFPNNELKVY